MFLRNWARLYSKQTPAELAMERHVCLLGERYRAQHPLFSQHRIADFALMESRVLIEVDGASHDTLVQRRKDLISTIQLEKCGWRVIRFRNEEVTTWDGETNLREIIVQKLNHRPTIPQLEEALRLLPDPGPGRTSSRTRGRRRAPGPTKAPSPGRKRKKVDSNSEDSTK